MYKITGNFHNEKINEVYATPAYALGVYMAYVEKWMPSEFSAEAVNASKDVFNNLHHQLKLSDDACIKIIIKN